jgi:hypothetical protein
LAQIVVPISQDRETIFQTFVDSMRTQTGNPDWQPADGSPDTFMAEAFADLTATNGELATDALTSVFRWYGANIAGVPPIDAVQATGSVTITVDVTTGYTIPAGLAIGVEDANGNLIGAETTEDAVFAPAVTTVAGVGITVTDETFTGAAGNDLPGPVQQVDSDVHITAITLDAATAGGSDAEDDDVYIPRLVEEEQTRSVAPILPRNFATLAKRVLEVDRAAVLNGYNTVDGTSNNALMITLVPVKADGTNVSAGGKTAVAELFAEDGETPALVGFVVNVADPHRTPIDVAWTGTAADGFDPADALAQGNAALAAFLDPTDWGQPPTGERRAFEVEPKVRYGRLQQILYQVEALAHVDTLDLSTAYVTNPGFETNTTGWVANAPSTYVAAGGTLTRVTAQHNTGVAAGQLVTPGGTANTGTSTSMAPTGGFIAGQRYTGVVFVKGNAGGEPLTVFFGDNSGDSATVTPTVTTSWQRVAVTWTPAANRATAYLGVRDTSTTAHTFFVDDAAVLAPADYTLPVTNAEPVGMPTNGVISGAVT